ncbi:MAG TPA: hypothetical protein VGJ46_05225, partial [Candidatus Limnocylindrales bacterium]
AEHRAAVDAFFARLNGVSDPAEFAMLARELPRMPDLDAIDGSSSATPVDSMTTRSDESGTTAPVDGPAPAASEEEAKEPQAAEQAAQENPSLAERIIRAISS